MKANNQKYITCLLVVQILLVSCETVVDVKIPQSKPQIVLNAFINPDSTFKADISASRNILDDSNFKWINGADIKLYDGDQLMGTFSESENGSYRLDDVKPQVGKMYRIEASKDQYQSVYAESMIPIEKARIQSALISSEMKEGYEQFFLEIEIDDKAGENFYELVVWRYNRTYTFQGYELIATDSTLMRVYIDSEDVAIDDFQDSGSSLVFSDVLFEGKTHKLKAGIGSFFDFDNQGNRIPNSYVISLRNTNEEYFRYQRSKALQEWVDGDPFAEPVQVFNNINNGFGIFAGYNETKINVIY
ncbi:DUF4249 domain-containing protein [Fulvivirgaceae bacterium BMA10]|uniref:DUF4249 domain-containing protein n=1 Tax=Splendidivirga corallicola TaxID=3051826 RepID=A0ABT8KMA4_9BACT|nr:DUF4249 domain-containing protein [Fulvivirgaceae bacterium BMA10]